MKALSIRQPWASLIVAGYKDIENRSWRTSYRGPVLIHSAQRVADVTLEEIARRLKVAIGPLPNKLARGGIIGIAEIVDCVAAHTSPWFEGPFGFVLRDARKLSFRPMPGRLSLFDISPNLLDP
jgi:hypothetical protein